jgi:hypothetical protein
VIILFGTKAYRETLAMVTFVCRVCGHPAAQRIDKLYTKFTVFFVPLFTVSTRYAVQCAMCGAASGIEREEAERLAAAGNTQPGPDLMKPAQPGQGGQATRPGPWG